MRGHCGPAAGLVLALITGVWIPVEAQASAAAELALRLAGMTAVTGYEQAMVDTLLSLLPGAQRDRAGNAVLTFGSGAPRRLAACPLDETGFAVGRLRPDGWLTLRRSPARIGPPGPLFDQQLEGQRVTVFGSRGAVPAVVAVRSVHLTRGRGPLAQEPFTVDDAYVDVGAGSDRQAAALGVAVLNPVALAKRPHRYGSDRFAAPWAGRRAACAALLGAARDAAPRSGTAATSGARSSPSWSSNSWARAGCSRSQLPAVRSRRPGSPTPPVVRTRCRRQSSRLVRAPHSARSTDGTLRPVIPEPRWRRFPFARWSGSALR